MLTYDNIRKMTDPRTFEKGRQIRHSKNKILDFNVQTERRYKDLSKTDYMVEAKVKGSNGEIYDVELSVDSDRGGIRRAYCDCLAFAKYNGLCKHCVAAALQFSEWQKEKPFKETTAAERQPAEHTSDIIKQLLEKQSKKKAAPVTQQDIYGKVRLAPELLLGPNNAQVSFKIGADKMYVLKDLQEFAINVTKEAQHMYGKMLDFVHTIDAFESESRQMVQFILGHFQQTVDEYNNSVLAYGVEPYLYHSSCRSISLTSEELENFLNACGDNPISVDTIMGDYVEHTKTYYNSNGWPVHNFIVKGERDNQGEIKGIRCETERMVLKRGTGHIFAFEEGRIYRTPLRGISAIAQWVMQISHHERRSSYERYLYEYFERRTGQNNSRECQKKEPTTESFYVEKADLPVFCRELLPQFKKIFAVQYIDFDPEDFTVSPTKYRFMLDSPQRDIVSCRTEVYYGERKYDLYTGDIPGTENIGSRDLADELAVSQLLMGIFPEGEREKKHWIIDNERALYELLTEGLEKMQQMGEVFVSDALKHMEVRRTPKISAGVSLSGNLLELSIESEELSGADLAEILSRYDRRKKYHRLKNGDFIKIDGEELDALADMSWGLGLSEKDIAKEVIKLPKFRALYLDSQMNDKAALQMERSRDFRALIRNMKTVEDNDFEVPVNLKNVLRSYQKKGFMWLKTLEANGFGGILADDMGLGKTLQVIAFLLSQKEEGRQSPNLIVCPASLIYNWENEIHRFAPSLKAKVIAGNGEERASLIAGIRGKGESAVYITSYELLRRDIELYGDIQFDCQVIDEAQYIKNHSTKAAHAVKEIKAFFKVALTGTPIENRLSELWSIFDYLMPGFLYSYEQFRRRIEKPVVSDGDSDAMERLQKMIAPFIIRRLKSDVLKDLPEKIEENLMTRLEGEQRELYDAQVQNLKIMLSKQDEDDFNKSKIAVLAQLTRLRQLCCDPTLVYEGYNGGASKVQLCKDLVTNSIESGHKILIFSQFTSMLEIMEDELRKEKIDYYKLTGSTSKEERIQLVETFNRPENKVSVFLISLKAGGTGLNLTAADIVIHFDPWWNLAAQNQATDRAHRIGQQNVVNVYKLIAKDTIEENILKLQEKKRELSDVVLSGDGVGTGTFTKEELMEILG